jgi:hypothetical protein
MYLDVSTKILDAAIVAGYLLHTDREAIVNAQQSKATSAFGTR